MFLLLIATFSDSSRNHLWEFNILEHLDLSVHTRFLTVPTFYQI